MLEGCDPDCGHSQQYFSVRDHWFWKLYELQPFITSELFRSHCTHISSPVFVGYITVWPRGPKARALAPDWPDSDGAPAFCRRVLARSSSSRLRGRNRGCTAGSLQ